MLKKLLTPFFLSCTLLMIGCSKQFQDVNSTFKEYWNGSDDIVLTPEIISELPYASAYVEINEQGQIFMVLAFAEANPDTGALQLKWMSSDRVMIVTENGRVVETLKLPYENLVSMINGAPAFDSSLKGAQKKWQSFYDWQPNYRFGYSAEVTREYVGDEVTVTPLETIKTQKFVEKNYFPKLEQEFENQFWVSQTGKVVKAIQYLGPEMTKIEITVLKGFKG